VLNQPNAEHTFGAPLEVLKRKDIRHAKGHARPAIHSAPKQSEPILITVDDVVSAVG
jgi:hypothetical protein